MLLLSRHDVLDLADALAAHGSIWVISLGRGEVVKRASVATSSASEVCLGCTRTVVADHLVDNLGVAQFGTSVAHQVRGIALTVIGECSEGAKAFTSLAPDSGRCQCMSEYGTVIYVLWRQGASVSVGWG